MSGVFWCCCVTAPPPPVCDCACVCAQPFQIIDEDTQQYLGAWHDQQLITGQEWTVVYWINTCGDLSELGVTFHQYDNDDNQTTIRMFSFPKPGETDTATQEFGVKIRDAQGNVVVTLGAVQVDYPIAAAGCKMMAFRFRRVTDPDTGFLIPELSIDVYTEPQKYQTIGTILGLPDRDVGYYPQVPQETWIGTLFPFDTPEYDPNFSFFSGCISNLMTFNARLSDATLDQLWNNGQGLNPSTVITWTETIDQWCAADPQPFQNAVGSKAGTVLEHQGVVWDQDGDGIQDQNNQFIQGVN